MIARLLALGVLLTIAACWGPEFTEAPGLAATLDAGAGDVDGARLVAQGDDALAGDDAAAGPDRTSSADDDDSGRSSPGEDGGPMDPPVADAAGDVAAPPPVDAGGGTGQRCTSGPSSCPACGFGWSPCCNAGNLCACMVGSVCR